MACAYVPVHVLQTVFDSPDGTKAPLSLRRIKTAFHGLSGLLSRVDHREYDSIRPLLQNALYKYGIVPGYSDNSRCPPGPHCHKVHLQGPVVNGRMFRIDPDKIIIQIADDLRYAWVCEDHMRPCQRFMVFQFFF